MVEEYNYTVNTGILGCIDGNPGYFNDIPVYWHERYTAGNPYLKQFIGDFEEFYSPKRNMAHHTTRPDKHGHVVMVPCKN